MGARVRLAFAASDMEHIGSDSQDENELLHVNASASREPSNLALGASASSAIHGCPLAHVRSAAVTKSGTEVVGAFTAPDGSATGGATGSAVGAFAAPSESAVGGMSYAP